MTSNFRRIGFIGLGVMGEPMCARLCAGTKVPVVAFDHDASALARGRERGAIAARSLSDAVAESDVLFLSLPSGEVVAELARAPGGLLDLLRPGQIVVDLSTSSVDSTRRLAEEFARQGVRFADAPVARTRAAAEAGTLLVMVGAEPSTFATLLPLLEHFASDIVLCGPVGCGQVLKILNNMILFENGVALAEAYAIGARSGVDPKLLFETLAKGSADSFALRNHGMKAILPQEFPLRAFSVEYARKDLQYALRLAKEVNVDARAARHVDELFTSAISAGSGQQYWPVISELLGRG